MIEELYADELARLYELFRNAAILVRWFRNARGVVVGQNNCGGTVFNGWTKDLCVDGQDLN